ncbi:MAG TPA: response regulator [Chloroflexota bacterium]
MAWFLHFRRLEIASDMAHRILVVDDDSTIVDLIKAVLADEGFAVTTALDGREALDGRSEGPPDLVVLDMFLPTMSGEEVADALRAKYGPDLPILVTSASKVDVEAQALGAYENLPKPFDLEELLAAVRRGLAGRR